MEVSSRSPGYDLFKFIVAIFLFILYLIFVRRSHSQSIGLAVTLVPTSPGQTLTVSPTTVPASPASLAQTGFPSPTGTTALAPTLTLLPSLTPTSVGKPTVIATTEPQSVTACDNSASHSRLHPGDKATILRRLNFRSSPGIRDNWLLTNNPGTQVEIIGGPQCLPYWTGSYMWWQIQLPDGRIGWSAEGSLHGSFYFMEPTQ